VASETACPECGHQPVGPDSCPACGAHFRDLPAWKRPKATIHGDRRLTEDEEDESTRFDPQERGAVAQSPWALVVAMLALSGYWAARLAGVFGEAFLEPRMLWFGVGAPLVVAAALVARRGARLSAAVMLPAVGALAIGLAFPAWSQPAVLAVVLAHLTPLLGLLGDPGAARRIVALAVSLLLLVAGVGLAMMKGSTSQPSNVDLTWGVNLELPKSMRAATRDDVDTYCNVPSDGVVAAFEDPEQRIGGVLLAARDQSLGVFIDQTAEHLGISQRERAEDSPVGALAVLTPELDEIRLTAHDQQRRGLAIFAKAGDGRVIALVLTGAPAVFPRLRSEFRELEQGVAVGRPSNAP
jgi:hypothetical protein